MLCDTIVTGLEEIGIFRLPGQTSRIQSLKDQYDQGWLTSTCTCTCTYSSSSIWILIIIPLIYNNSTINLLVRFHH